MDTPHVESSARVDNLTPQDTPLSDLPAMALNVHVNEAMNDLLRACAIEWLFLPVPVWEAYTDRDHSKFDLHTWNFYLVGLMQAIRQNRKETPRRVMVAYRRVRAAYLLSEVVPS